jgi:hypothetical protein
MNVALSLYAIDWKRAQLQTGKSGAAGILNVGDVKGKGVELFISHRTPIEGLSWQFAGNWNDTKLKDIDPNILAGLPHLFNGMQLPPVPKWSATTLISYEHPTNYYDLTLIADARYTYRSRMRDLATGRQSDDVHSFSADIGVRKDNYSIQLFADNIANEDGPTIWEQGRMIVPRPRTIGVRFAFDGF